jgi:hypothetical protein
VNQAEQILYALSFVCHHPYVKRVQPGLRLHSLYIS